MWYLVSCNHELPWHQLHTLVAEHLVAFTFDFQHERIESSYAIIALSPALAGRHNCSVRGRGNIVLTGLFMKTEKGSVKGSCRQINLNKT